MLISSTHSVFLLLSLFTSSVNAHTRTFHRREISKPASQFCTTLRSSPSHLLGCSRSQTSVSHLLQICAGAPSCWYMFEGMSRQKYLLRVLEFHFRKRSCKCHLPVETVISTAQTADYHSLTEKRVGSGFWLFLANFYEAIKGLSCVDHYIKGKLFPVRERNVVFQPGLSIYPKTQYYPFSR